MNMDDSDSSLEEELDRLEEGHSSCSSHSKIKRKCPNQVQAFVDSWLTDKQLKGGCARELEETTLPNHFARCVINFWHAQRLV